MKAINHRFHFFVILRHTIFIFLLIKYSLYLRKLSNYEISICLNYYYHFCKCFWSTNNYYFFPTFRSCWYFSYNKW